MSMLELVALRIELLLELLELLLTCSELVHLIGELAFLLAQQCLRLRLAVVPRVACLCEVALLRVQRLEFLDLLLLARSERLLCSVCGLLPVAALRVIRVLLLGKGMLSGLKRVARFAQFVRLGP